jgi:transposase-like protein
MQSRLRLRPRKTSTERAQILAARAQSGLSDREFSGEHGIAASTLYRWLRQAPADRRSGRGGLIEIPNVLGHRPAVAAYRLLFPRGLILEVAPGFPPEELRSLAQLLQSL